MTHHRVRRHRQLRRVASLSLLLLGACTASRTQAAAGDSASAGDSAGDDAAFGLERGSCYGSCPVYAVRLFDDGRVHFTGTRFVRAVGSDSARIAPAAVAAMRTAFATRAFELVPAAIEYGTPSCGQYVADLSTVVLTSRTPRGTHTVRFDEGCTAHPPMLDTLSRMLDSIGGTARWTTPAKP
jgi:Domain of unknown function (DUF6438)